MATAPALPYVGVAEYLTADYEPYCEYIDGTLEQKSLPDHKHSRLQTLLAGLLLAQEDRLGYETCTELHVWVTPTRFRIPDLCGLTSKPQDHRYADRPPLFTIEIVSSDEPWQKLRAKVRDHQSMGVPFVIVADPYTKTVLMTDNGLLRELPAPLMVSIEVEGRGTLQIDFDELFRRVG
ncbi:MAG: Uma2 family endonuclease [Bryobacteraceae bacterium]|nr:Uma2 family endonuclease [Bryobacteraceae bacterium]